MPLRVVDAALGVRAGDELQAEDLGAQQGRVLARVAEALDRHRGALQGRCRAPSRPRGSRRCRRARSRRRGPPSRRSRGACPVITPGWCSPTMVSYSSIIQPMISGVVYTSGAGTSFVVREEPADGADVRPREPLLLARGQLLRVAGDAALAAPERQVDDGGLPGHPRRQGAHGVDGLVGVPAQAALRRARAPVVLHPVAVEHLHRPVVHAHGEVHLQLALRPAQELVRRLVEAELRRRRCRAGSGRS